MPQVLKGNIAYEVPIPDDSFLIKKSEYEFLEDEAAIGKLWHMDDLRAWLGNHDGRWIEEFILYNPRFSVEMHSLEQQGLLHFTTGKGKGNGWWFNAPAIKHFIQDHWDEIEWNAKRKRR